MNHKTRIERLKRQMLGLTVFYSIADPKDHPRLLSEILRVGNEIEYRMQMPLEEAIQTVDDYYITIESKMNHEEDYFEAQSA